MKKLTRHVAIVLGLVFVAFPLLMALIYENDVYKPIGCLSALSLIFSTMDMVPNALMMKNKRFYSSDGEEYGTISWC